MAPIGAELRNDISGVLRVAVFCSASFFVVRQICQSRTTSISTGRMQAKKHCFALAKGPIQVSGALTDFRVQVVHQDDREGISVAHWVFIQSAAEVEFDAATRENFHMRQPFVRLVVKAAAAECLFFEPLLNPNLATLRVSANPCASERSFGLV